MSLEPRSWKEGLNSGCEASESGETWQKSEGGKVALRLCGMSERDKESDFDFDIDICEMLVEAFLKSQLRYSTKMKMGDQQ